MSIKCKYTTETGIELQDAYVTIKSAYVQKDKILVKNMATEEYEEKKNFSCISDIEVYANQAAYESNKPIVETVKLVFVFDMLSNANSYTQTYEFAKTTDKFINPIDC